jgi:uncharacterized membrane protein
VLDERSFKKEEKESWLITHLGRIILGLALIGGAIAIVVVGTYTSHFSSDFATKNESWGQFGDYFGGILNPTFSFLALIALLCTLYVQRYELKKAQGEFNLSSEIQLLAQIVKCKDESIRINLEQYQKFNELAEKLADSSNSPNFKKAANCYLEINGIENYQKNFYENRIEEIMELISGLKLTEHNRKKAELNRELKQIIDEIKNSPEVRRR